MKLNIKNPKILALILVNTILLTQSGSIKNSNRRISNCATTTLEKTSDEKFDSISNQEKTDLDIQTKQCNNNVCGKKKLLVREENNKKSKIILKVGKYQKLKEIGKTEDGWSLVKYKTKGDSVKGYVKSKELANLGNDYIEVDISEQKGSLYKNGKKDFSFDVVTGKDSTPTVTGLFNVYAKNRNYTMRGNNYTSFSQYVVKFYNAYYFHDASWRSEFGKKANFHTNGSHGCVNMKIQDAKKLYHNVKIKTKVLIHK